MGLFDNTDGGLMDEIRCDEQDYLVWRWHPRGTSPTASHKATSIRWGSSLHVVEGSVAIFAYSDENGAKRDFIEGPYDGIVSTNNLPVIANLVGKLYDGGTPFPAEVYFINLANLIQMKFGVPYFDVFDYRRKDYGIPVAVRGSFNFKITDYRKFVELRRLGTFSMSDFQAQIRDAVVRHVKQVVINATDGDKIPAIQVERHLDEINDLVAARIVPALREDYGVTVTGVNIAHIEMDRNSEGYRKVLTITQNKAADFMHAAGNILEVAGGGAADALGGAAGALGNAAGAIGSSVGGFLSGFGKRKAPTPPPVPIVKFYVAISGEQAGPFTMRELRSMVASGDVDESTLVWKDGMKNWAEAGSIDALQELFSTGSDLTPPPIA